MPWRGAGYKGEFPSLGWGVIDWWSRYLRLPSGPKWGQPFEAYDDQVRYVVRLYRLDPKSGQLVYRRAASREAKGKGKSPIAAALALAEFAGPVVFDGWDAAGEPVGVPRTAPWVQVAACSEDQAGNTYSAVFEELRDSDALEELRIDIGRTRIQFFDRPGKIEAVTAAAGSREGQPITFAVLDETHLWLRSNGGTRMAATLRRNVAKMGGRTVETTNAFLPGENSVAEDTHAAAQRGEPGLLYEATEAPWVENLADKRALKRGLKVAYGDSAAPKGHVNLDRLVAEFQDPATDPSDGRRFFLNQLVQGSDQAVDPHRWAQLARRDVEVSAGSTIAVGFEGSINRAATSLVGCTAAGYLFVLGVWERPAAAPRDWRIPRLEVHAALLAAKDRYRVARVFAAPAQWQSEIEDWTDIFGKDIDNDPVVVAFDTNSTVRMSRACDRFATALTESKITHAGDDVLTRHALAMARHKVRVRDDDNDGRTRYVFVPSDRRPIGAGVAAVLAVEAAATVTEHDPAEPFTLPAATTDDRAIFGRGERLRL